MAGVLRGEPTPFHPTLPSGLEPAVPTDWATAPIKQIELASPGVQTQRSHHWATEPPTTRNTDVSVSGTVYKVH